MQESITIAVVGSIVKVSGRRMATPFGPPNPGSTPTKMPSTSPMIIIDRIFHVIRTANPCSSSESASIVFRLVSEGRFEWALGHDHVEGDLERAEHDEREEKAREDRL